MTPTDHERSLAAIGRMEAAQRARKEPPPVSAATGEPVQLLEGLVAAPPEPDPGAEFAADLQRRMGWQNGGPAL